MADPSSFGNFFSSVTGMGDPMTKTSTTLDPLEAQLLEKADPTVALAILSNRKREDIYNDPQRTRELLSVFNEFDEQRALKAAKIQAERDKRAFQYQMMAKLPETVNQIGANLAQMTYNAPRLQILADIPNKMLQAYGSMPRINIPDFK